MGTRAHGNYIPCSTFCWYKIIKDYCLKYKILRSKLVNNTDFWDDLRAQDADDNVSMLVFSEFGRRVKENGGGLKIIFKKGQLDM